MINQFHWQWERWSKQWKKYLQAKGNPRHIMAARRCACMFPDKHSVLILNWLLQQSPTRRALCKWLTVLFSCHRPALRADLQLRPWEKPNPDRKLMFWLCRTVRRHFGCRSEYQERGVCNRPSDAESASMQAYKVATPFCVGDVGNTT